MKRDLKINANTCGRFSVNHQKTNSYLRWLTEVTTSVSSMLCAYARVHSLQNQCIQEVEMRTKYKFWKEWLIHLHWKLYNTRKKQYVNFLFIFIIFLSRFVKTHIYNFSSYGKTIEQNNFMFIISHTFSLVRTGFCNWGKEWAQLEIFTHTSR